MAEPSIDPNKLDFKVEYRFLAREITVTLRVSDDKTYKLLVDEVQELEKDMTEVMKELKASKP